MGKKPRSHACFLQGTDLPRTFPLVLFWDCRQSTVTSLNEEKKSQTPLNIKPRKPKNTQEVCPQGSLHGNWGTRYVTRREHNSQGGLCTHSWNFILRHAARTTNRLISRKNSERATQKGPPRSPKDAFTGRRSKFQGKKPSEREGMGLGAGLLEKGSCSCFHIHLLF